MLNKQNKHQYMVYPYLLRSLVVYSLNTLLYIIDGDANDSGSLFVSVRCDVPSIFLTMMTCGVWVR